MAYNKASEERKWHYWKEREEKKLRELGMDEEKIRKLRQMDWEDFLEERRYRERLEETMQEIDTGKPEDGEPFAMDVRELLDHVGDRRLYELLKDTEHQTLEILCLVHGDIRLRKSQVLWDFRRIPFIRKERFCGKN